jgi:hypothetical protein
LAFGLDRVLWLVDIGWHVVLDIGTVGNLVILRRQIDRAVGNIKCNVGFNSVVVIVKDACPAIAGASGSVVKLGQSCRVEWSPSRYSRHRNGRSASRSYRSSRTNRTLHFRGLCCASSGVRSAPGGRCRCRSASRTKYCGARSLNGPHAGGSGRKCSADFSGWVEFVGKIRRDETLLARLVVVFVIINVLGLVRLEWLINFTIDRHHILFRLPSVLVSPVLKFNSWVLS